MATMSYIHTKVCGLRWDMVRYMPKYVVLREIWCDTCQSMWSYVRYGAIHTKVCGLTWDMVRYMPKYVVLGGIWCIYSKCFQRTLTMVWKFDNIYMNSTLTWKSHQQNDGHFIDAPTWNTCHNVPESGQNWPHMRSIWSILSQFWYIVYRLCELISIHVDKSRTSSWVKIYQLSPDFDNILLSGFF